MGGNVKDPAGPEAPTVAPAERIVPNTDPVPPPSERASQDAVDFEQRASLVILTGNRAGRTFPVDGDLILGRDCDCAVSFDAANISRHHARISRLPNGQYLLEDLRSRNGTTLNGLPVMRHVLRFGDRISVGGEALLLFTQHDSLQEQLLHQQRMESIGQLAGGVAHDFNNLLGTMVANIGVLFEFDPRTPLGSGEIREVIGDIHVAAQRATDLTKQLLGFARRGKIEERPTDMSDIIEDVVRLCRRTFDPNIEIVTEVESSLVVVGDRAQLHQVVMNLMLNARDAMRGGGTITIEASRKQASGDDRVAITVIDTGEGMPEETRQRVFEPFYTTKALGQGTGLGLATVYGIVQSHCGEIEVDSKVGVGTAFHVALPLVDVDSDTDVPTDGAVHFLDPPSGAVLIVDDEDLYVRSSARLIRQLGYEVLVARNGEQALDVFQRNRDRIQVVLLDLVMPVMPGDVACGKLKDIDGTARIIVTSAFSEPERIRALVANGAAGFLRKPFERAELETAINEALSQVDAAALVA